MGKTVWARSHGPHAYFGGLFSLDELSKECRYAVFDDIAGGIEYFPQYKSWLGGQKQFYSTDKYRKKQLVSWGKPTIWLSNDNPAESPKADYEWLMGNCIFIHIGDPLY